MKKIVCLFVLLWMVQGCSKREKPATSAAAPAAKATAEMPTGPFSSEELRQFTALDPIDSHTHVYAESPAFYAMLKKLNLRLVDILVDDNRYPGMNLSQESEAAWGSIRGSDGRIVLCTTFDPYTFRKPNFVKESLRKINGDFAKGAIAVKLYKNVGTQIKDAKGNYLMPDNPVFEPIYKDIAAHNKTLIAHIADPDDAWEPLTPTSMDYAYFSGHPKEYFYNKPNAPSKAKILQARDRVLEENPDLRMVGAHLGSMESNFQQLGEHFDRYPNFAVDLAARMPYFERQPRAAMIAFITKYQDRLIYGTDHQIFPGQNTEKVARGWEVGYAREWRYLATNDTQTFGGHNVQGLALPKSILQKIYHDNAVKWFPGILTTPNSN